MSGLSVARHLRVFVSPPSMRCYPTPGCCGLVAHYTLSRSENGMACPQKTSPSIMLAKDDGGEREPHRARTCNLLIKSLSYSVPKDGFTFKLEPFCQLVKTFFMPRISTRYIPFYSVG